MSAKITKEYPNIVKWLKTARAAALKGNGSMLQIGSTDAFTYVTDGYAVLRIPAAQLPAWSAAVSLAPIDGQEMSDDRLIIISDLSTPSSFDKTLLDTGVLAYVKCKSGAPLCRVYAFDDRPYAIQETSAAALRDIGGPVIAQAALTESFCCYPAKAGTEGGPAVMALPIRIDRDPRQEKILSAAAKAARNCREEDASNG